MVAAETGSFARNPGLAAGGPNICLGKTSDYPVTSRFPAGACIVNTANSAQNSYVNSTLNSEIQMIQSDMSAVPAKYESQYNATTWWYRGAHISLSGVGFEMEAALPGNISCPSNMREYDIGSIHWCELANN